MDTSLQSTHLSTDELSELTPFELEQQQEAEENVEEHLPSPSLWPFILGLAVLITMGGFIFIRSTPWISIIGIPFVLISVLGWGLQNPMAHHATAEAEEEHFATSYAEAATTGKPTPLAEMVLEQAQDVVEHDVTIATTAWSAHPVKVFIERDGVVLSLYGKVELAAQRKELENNLRQIPGVLDVMNFVVAEDTLLDMVNTRIAQLKEGGKLEGARDLSVLVENGIVSLYGFVPNHSMKYMLEKEIIGIQGVRVVINHIGLDEDIPGNLGKTTNKVGG
jgi:osmotically-inducible protein OsmY